MTLRIDPDVLTWITKRPGTRTAGEPLPCDAKVVNRAIDQRGDILLLIESAEYPETSEGQPYPEMVGPSFESPDSPAYVPQSDRDLIVQAIVRLEQLGDTDLAIRLAHRFEVKVWEEDGAKVREAERLADPLCVAKNLALPATPPTDEKAQR